MKHLILNIAFLITSLAFAAKPDTVVQYLLIQENLANDNFTGLSLIAQKIAKNEKGAKAEKLALELSKSKNIVEARQQFKILSSVLIGSISKKELGDLKIASCPMANAKWIQKGSQVRNPYYGASMLECGAIEE